MTPPDVPHIPFEALDARTQAQVQRRLVAGLSTDPTERTLGWLQEIVDALSRLSDFHPVWFEVQRLLDHAWDGEWTIEEVLRAWQRECPGPFTLIALRMQAEDARQRVAVAAIDRWLAELERRLSNVPPPAPAPPVDPVAAYGERMLAQLCRDLLGGRG